MNLAARLEGLTKYYGVSILVGENLAARLPGFALIELDIIRVVGRETPERVFALTGPPDTASSPAFTASRDGMSALLSAYRLQDWAAAEAALAALRAAGTVAGLESVLALYAARIADYLETPPPEGWDGVSQALEK